MKIIKYLVIVGLIFFSSLASAGQILIAGAASLTDAFNALANKYQELNPDIKILTSFAASDIVLQQVINGAPVNIFASADQITMDRAADKELLVPDSRVNFIGNKLVLIVPKIHKTVSDINSLDDLLRLSATDKNLKIAIANPASVPAGRYTKDALTEIGAWDKLISHQINGQNVRQILNYVQRAEVDAGFVFASDAFIAADKVKIIADIPTKEPILYPIAEIKSPAIDNLAQGAGFIDFVLSKQGQKILQDYGFEGLK